MKDMKRILEKISCQERPGKLLDKSMSFMVKCSWQAGAVAADQIIS
jgi:hypothetical protein